MATDAVKAILKKFNVWAKNEKGFAARHDNYCVAEDKNALQCLEKELSGLYNMLRFDLLPDPVSGDIDAPIVMILNNPGVAAIDVYNYSDVSQKTKDAVLEGKARDIAEKQRKNAKYVGYDLTFKFSGDEEQVQLQRRRAVLLQQYRLEAGTEPYSLDPSFDTVALKGLPGRVGGSLPLCGSFLWTKALLTGKSLNDARRLIRKIFDIEFFPYHSKHFDMKAYIEYERVHRNDGMLVAHSRLRDELIREFAREGRIFAVRSKYVSEYLRNDLGVDPALIITFKSSQRVTFSSKNLTGDSTATLEKVKSLLELQK